MVIDRHSLLELSAGSQLVIEKGAKLYIRGQGQLLVGDDAQIIIKRGGKLYVEADGRFREMPEARINIERGGKLKGR
jgi:hypothetical protein